jgi:fucose permease
MNLLQPMMVAALLVSGMGVAILGSVKVPLARRLQIDEARVGGLVSLFGFAMGVCILAAGFLADHFGRQLAMVGGSLLVAASLFCLGAADTYRKALLAVVLLSGGWALLIVVGNLLTVPAFGDPDSRDSAASAYNLANVFFGMGAFLTPLAIAWLLGRTSFFLALSIVGLIALVPGVLALAVTFAPPPSSADFSVLALLQHPMLWLCALALFFYGPLEASMGAWATSLLGEHGTPEKTASQLLSGYWLLFMATRLLTALLLEFFKPVPTGTDALLILIMSLCCIALFVNVVYCRGKLHAIILVLAAGALFGPIFPTLISVLLRYFPDSGRAVGLFFAIGGIGWTVIPMLIGAYAKKTSVQRGFVIAIGAAIGLSVVAGILVAQK